MGESPLVRDKFVYRPLVESTHDIKRTRLAYILIESKLEQVAIGKSLPRLSKIRVVSDGTELPLTLAMQLDYDGGFTSVIKFETVFGMNFWLLNKLNVANGTLYMTLFDNLLYYGFSPLDRLEMQTRLSVEGYELAFFSHLLSKYYFPWWVRKKWVLPAMKSKLLLK